MKIFVLRIYVKYLIQKKKKIRVWGKNSPGRSGYAIKQFFLGLIKNLHIFYILIGGLYRGKRVMFQKNPALFEVANRTEQFDTFH